MRPTPPSRVIEAPDLGLLCRTVLRFSFLSSYCNLMKENTMSELTMAQRTKLMSDLKVVVADAEALLKLTAHEVGEGAAALRTRLQERLAHSRQSLVEMQATATQKAKVAGQAADDYVHAHPWKAMAVGAGVGVIVGLLIQRR